MTDQELKAIEDQARAIVASAGELPITVSEHLRWRIEGALRHQATQLQEAQSDHALTLAYAHEIREAARVLVETVAERLCTDNDGGLDRAIARCREAIRDPLTPMQRRIARQAWLEEAVELVRAWAAVRSNVKSNALLAWLEREPKR